MSALALVALLTVAALAARSAWRARVAPELARLRLDVQELTARVAELERGARRPAARVAEAALAARVSDDAPGGDPAPQPRGSRTVH